MGASFNKTVRKYEEESGCTRGGARFRQEKRQRTGEGLSMIKTQYREVIHMGHSDPTVMNKVPRIVVR